VKVHQATLQVRTSGRGFHDVTESLREIVTAAAVTTGLCAVFVQHTSASLVVQENADPAVLRDLQRWMEQLAPERGATYEHDAEGPDDMPAHLRSAVTRSSEVLPITGGRLSLGTWQAVYLWEHRRAAHVRSLVVTVTGV
jgi:secondary thiamine-phosphate synthase enzyme